MYAQKVEVEGPKKVTQADIIRAQIEEQNKKFLEHKALVS